MLYGIYGEKAAIRVSDYKLIIKEPYIPFNPRPVAKGEFDRLRAPLTIWNAELECHIYNDSIGCWPEREPCLFNVRYDPCEMNNLAYYMPETVKTLMWNLNQSNETAIYRERRRRSILGDKMNPISKRLKESEMKRRQQRLSERKHN